MKPPALDTRPASPRRIRFPIGAKIAAWFVLNLIFLAAAAFFLLRSQFRLDSLLAGQASDRIQAMTEIIVGELDARRDWDTVLARSAAAYRLQIALMAPDGTLLAGSVPALPQEVLNKLRAPAPFGNRPHRPPPDRPPGGDPAVEGFPPPPPPSGPFPPRPHANPPAFPKSMIHTTDPSRYWILVRIILRQGLHDRPMPATLLIASDSLQANGLLFDFKPWLAAGGGALLLSVLFWLPLLRSLTRPIAQMTRAAEQIAGGEFHVNLDTSRRDELGRLATALAQMSTRLEETFSGQKRFLGDTAHELCSPLARMEMALAAIEHRTPEDGDALLGDVREDVREMSSLVNDLLAFSKASTAAQEIRLMPVQLAPLAATVIRREAGAATVTSSIPDHLTALADPDLLARALRNVIRNAVRYAAGAGPVTIAAATSGDEVLISVSDCGSGVPEHMLHRLFDPFFRPESARTRETGGTGLGLTIVKSCVEACRGTVSLKNLEPVGFCVEIRLPRPNGEQ